jgi:ribosomal protein S6
MINPGQVTEAWDRIKGFITGRQADINHEERWGTRRLAYPIRKGQYQFLEGNYHITRFSTEQPFNRELETFLRLDDYVLRSMVTTTLPEDELAAQIAAQTRAVRAPPPRPAPAVAPAEGTPPAAGTETAPSTDAVAVPIVAAEESAGESTAEPSVAPAAAAEEPVAEAATVDEPVAEEPAAEAPPAASEEPPAAAVEDPAAEAVETPAAEQEAPSPSEADAAEEGNETPEATRES